MAKDYKPAPTRSTGGGGGKGMNPMFAGILIGLLMGILLALGIALWLNRANNPFVEKARPVEALPTIASKSSPAKPEPSKDGAGKDGDKPRFEFYQTLPGEKDGAAHAKKAADAPAKAAAESKPSPDARKETTPAKPADSTKDASKEIYFLQAGAFQNETEAENMKAKIAFAGKEAHVRPVNVPEKGTLYRVRLGPYKNIEELNRIKAELSQVGLSTAVVKAE